MIIQHKTLLQTLHSGRCGILAAPNYNYTLGQARSDVMFSLLFGGRIAYSAGTFFDSPTALRVFGELFCFDSFEEISTKFHWKPLELVMDEKLGEIGPREYIVRRWREPERKCWIFREDDIEFEKDYEKDLDVLKLSVKERKLAIAQAIEDDNRSQFQDLYQAFTKNVKMPGVADSYTPIIDDRFAKWLFAIIDYLERNRSVCFRDITDSGKAKLSKFSTIDCVESRTAHLAEKLRNERIESFDSGNLAELQSMNMEMRSRLSDSKGLNPFHNIAESIYKNDMYMRMTHNWLEEDWHNIRYDAYSSSTCLLSSDFEQRQMFDIDNGSKSLYLSDACIMTDGPLRQIQEVYGKFYLSILLTVVSSSDWVEQVNIIKQGDGDHRKISNAVNKIIALFAKHTSDFEVNSKEGRISIKLNKIEKWANVLQKIETADVYISPIFEGALEYVLGVRVCIPKLPAEAVPITKSIMYLRSAAQYIKTHMHRNTLRRKPLYQLYIESDCSVERR